MISTFNFKRELRYKITLIIFKSNLTTAYRINSTVKYKYKANALYVNRFYANSDILKIYLFILVQEETVEYITRNMWYPIYSPLVHEK
jgi:hypothetical protein